MSDRRPAGGTTTGVLQEERLKGRLAGLGEGIGCRHLYGRHHAVERRVQHARRAICALANELDALVLGYPENEPDKWDFLTVDGVLDVAGQGWAVDHVRATWEPLTTAEDALRHLKPRLDAIAERHQIGLRVGIYPPRGEGRTAYYDDVVDRAKGCAVSGRDDFGNDALTTRATFRPRRRHHPFHLLRE